ncbi:MAG: glycoside hydrolase family 36 protein [Victivallaceae bacterium]
MNQVIFNFSNNHKFCGVTCGPDLNGRKLPNPDFDANGIAVYPDCQLKREIHQLGADTWSVCLEITNTSKKNIPLAMLEVMRFENEFFPGVPFDNYIVDRLARQKNDLPGPFMPGKADRRLRDAAFSSAEVVAGGGIGWSEFDSPDAVLPTKFDADPGLIVTAMNLDFGIFLGFDGQHSHLNNIEFSTNSERTKMEKTRAIAELDGVILHPGESRRTHNLIIECAASRKELFARHVERIASRYGVRHSPYHNIYCTWYYYGPHISENEIIDNINAISEHDLELEVFQIDMGWENNFGDWEANLEKFPSGMSRMAELIKAKNMCPGIWTAPLVISPESEVVKKYPSIVLRNHHGEPCIFKCCRGNCYTLDPFAPEAPKLLQEFYSRLKKWGYSYHKLDFMRAVFIHNDANFYQPNVTRAEAYIRALKLIREALGDDAVINACGGLYDASAGLAEIIRSGADLRGHWDGEGSDISAYVTRIKQNVCRNFYNHLWTADPDALQLRRNSEAWAGDEKHAHLSAGKFSDDEAFSIAVNQFLSGGIVCVSERFKTFDVDRLEILKTLVPNYAPVPEYFGEWNEYLPEKFVTTFDKHKELPPWHVVTVTNWNSNDAKTVRVKISDIPCLLSGKMYAAFDFKTQKSLGVFAANETLKVVLEPHSADLIRLTPLNRSGKILIGSNINMSMGMEIKSIKQDGSVILKCDFKKRNIQFKWLDFSPEK